VLAALFFPFDVFGAAAAPIIGNDGRGLSFRAMVVRGGDGSLGENVHGVIVVDGLD